LQAWQQESIVRYASYGYLMSSRDTEDFVVKISGFHTDELATISASIDFDLNNFGWDNNRTPLINIDFFMTGVRMNLSVTTLHTVLNTITQTLVLNSIRTQRNATRAEASKKVAPPPKPKPLNAEAARSDDSGLIQALHSVKVKVGPARWTLHCLRHLDY
jgi:hypothetical protein